MSENRLYTREEVIKLLEEQKQICYESAKIIETTYINPYSESDGDVTRRIDRKSIINAKLPNIEI